MFDIYDEFFFRKIPPQHRNYERASCIKKNRFYCCLLIAYLFMPLTLDTWHVTITLKKVIIVFINNDENLYYCERVLKLINS